MKAMDLRVVRGALSYLLLIGRNVSLDGFHQLANISLGIESYVGGGDVLALVCPSSIQGFPGFLTCQFQLE